MPIAQIQTTNVQAAQAADPPEPYAITDGVTIIAYAIIAAAAFAAWGIVEGVKPGPFVPPPGISLFAVLYVVAQALWTAHGTNCSSCGTNEG